MNLEQLIDKIIPPADYLNRKDFSNTDIIDQLNDNEKKLIEDILIERLLDTTDDMLIIDTLAYLKSEKSLPILYNFLKNDSDSMFKLVVATSIFEINRDQDMINVAVDSFKKLKNDKDAYRTFKLIPAFYYLAKFKFGTTNKLIEEYTEDKEH